MSRTFFMGLLLGATAGIATGVAGLAALVWLDEPEGDPPSGPEAVYNVAYS